MTYQETQRLLAYWRCAKLSRSHMPRINGRRTIKGNASGVNQVLRSSYIKPQVGINKFVR